MQTFYFPCGLGQGPGLWSHRFLGSNPCSFTSWQTAQVRDVTSGHTFLPLQEEDDSPNQDLTGHLVKVAGAMSHTC